MKPKIHLILLAACLVAPCGGLAQDVTLPNPSGKCTATYFQFQGVCVSSKAVEEKGAGAIARAVAEFQARNRSKVNTSICKTKIESDNGDIVKLENGGIVEISSGYLGYVGYRKDALLFQSNGAWRLFIEGKKVFSVDVLRAQNSCSPPSTFPIEAAARDEIFIINGEKFKAQTYCLGWSEGEQVAFVEGSEYGACASAVLFNINQAEVCEVWCE